ncbi:MAG: M6 family metalloprotease domain-containing protein [Bacteroidaceae bacterium]|nr:M6 family metalloprotease domain-containing protein [Bacteroidaceae bacterium]
MKNLFVTAMLFMTTLGAMALPVKKGVWKVLPLADGTEVKAHLVGDEYCRYWLGVDGNRYVASEDGYVIMPETLISEGKVKFQKNQKRRMSRIQKATKRQSNYSGQKKGLIVLAQFPDAKFHDNDPQAFFDKVANQPQYSDDNGFVGSVYDYFMEQSYKKFELTFDVYGPVTVSGTVASYGRNRNGEDVAAGKFAAEVVKLVKSQVTDWKQYDWNNDDEIDQVMIVYAGYGEADGGGDNTIYPHEWTLSYSEYGDTISVGNGLYVDTYAVSNERAYTEGVGFRYDGLGGICHEFAHCLGLPDMYCTDGGFSDMGAWDQMASGTYNGLGFVPAGFTSYERMWAGWLQPTELTTPLSVSAMQPLTESDEAYIIYNQANRNEYYLLENRQFTGFDAALPAEGLLILHVDYDANIWEDNFVNTSNDNSLYGALNDHQRCVPFRADGKDYYVKYSNMLNEIEDYDRWYEVYDAMNADIVADIYPQPGNNQLTNTSVPRAFTYNKNKDGRKLMNVSITNITQNDNGTIAFDFAPDNTGSGQEGDNTDYGDGANPKPEVEGALLYESFDLCSGKGGNDGSWNGNIANSAFNPDNEGWVADKAYGGSKCAKFGTSSVAGSATTPAFELNDTTTLTFKAGAWNANNDGTILNLSASNGQVIPASVTLTKGEWTDFTITLIATGSTAVTFEMEKGRFFLDEVFVAAPAKDEPDNPDNPETIFQKMDIDHDGEITVNDITSLITIYLNSPAE